MQSNKSKIEQIIADSLSRHKEQRREYTLFGKFFYLKEPFLGNIDVHGVIETLETSMPSHLFDEIDEVLVGDFDFLHERSLEAMYKDGAIYVTNQIQSAKDLIENIVHEASHSLEYSYGAVIYGDRKINAEFIGKRERLRSILQSEGYKVASYDFEDVEYDEEFDAFLYKEVGYVKLNNLVNGLFVSSYAVTSLKEYWAVGFEDYFIGDRDYLKTISPILFRKIEEVITYED